LGLGIHKPSAVVVLEAAMAAKLRGSEEAAAVEAAGERVVAR